MAKRDEGEASNEIPMPGELARDPSRIVSIRIKEADHEYLKAQAKKAKTTFAALSENVLSWYADQLRKKLKEK